MGAVARDDVSVGNICSRTIFTVYNCARTILQSVISNKKVCNDLVIFVLFQTVLNACTKYDKHMALIFSRHSFCVSVIK